MAINVSYGLINGVKSINLIYGNPRTLKQNKGRRLTFGIENVDIKS